MNNNYCIYVHITPSKKLYIGMTNNIKRRWHEGLGYIDSDRKVQLPFANAILKYGWDNIQHIVLMDNLSKEVACECEKYLIAKYKTQDRRYGYNISNGGEGNCGYTHTKEACERLRQANLGKCLSEETKRKISNSMVGKNTWQKGRKLSQETRDKLSVRRKGHIVTQETRDKISRTNTGYKHTEEARKKMSEHNCMHREEIRQRISQSLKKSGKERAQKRLQTMKERYPEGIKQSEESNRKRSVALKGRCKSEETKQRMRKPKSPETVERMKQAQIISHRARKLGITYKEYIRLYGGR